MEEVERLPLAEVGVEVDQVEAADDGPALERERRARPDQPAPPDDTDDHETNSLGASRSNLWVYLAAPFIDCITWSVIALTSASKSGAAPPGAVGLRASSEAAGWPAGRCGF